MISEILEPHLWEVLMARALGKDIALDKNCMRSGVGRVSQDRKQERDRAGARGVRRSQKS